MNWWAKIFAPIPSLPSVKQAVDSVDEATALQEAARVKLEQLRRELVHIEADILRHTVDPTREDGSA